MKKALMLAGVFALGGVVATVAMWFGILLPAREGAQMIYASGLEGMAQTAMMIRRDKQKQLLANIDMALPQWVEATHSFGDHDYTRWSLWQVRDYYQTCNVPVPPEISQILASLATRPPRPPSSCQLLRDAEDKIGSTNSVSNKIP